MEILQVTNLHKSFGSNQVINDLSFSVQANTVYGFLGQNGAGKTTVMKMILGLHKIDSGQVFVNHQAVNYGNTKTNKDIGYLADVPAFYDYMSAREYLKLCGKISKVKNLNQRISEMLELVGLDDNNHKIKGYSRGMRQRLGIAQALLHKPLLLICDEPTSALDPIGRKQILDILASAASTTTVIFSTHILSDVERICDHVGILHNGSLVIDTDINTLTDKYTANQIKLSFGSQTELNNFIAKRNLNSTIDNLDLTITDLGLDQIYHIIAESKIYPVSLQILKPSLESVFLEVTNV